MEVHGEFGDVAALAGRLAGRGFAIDVRDNDGHRVPASSERACYLHGSRR
jgi:hypothetical protein